MSRGTVSRCLITAIGWIGCAAVVCAQTGQPPSAEPRLEFSHPPLLYDGPDPTANQLLPVPLEFDTRLSTLGGLSTDSKGSSRAESIESFLPNEWLDPSLISASGVTDQKSGVFQKLSFSVGWLNGDKPNGYALTELDLFATFAAPFPTREWPLLLTPTFNVRQLDGPQTIDLPAQVYEAFVDFTWLPKIRPRWLGILSVAPSVYSDLERSSGAFRLTGRALVRFDWTADQLQLIFGVLYLNRDDVKLLPAGGIIWIPSPSRRYEILFPKPTLAHRFRWGPGFEDWVYLAGEFGGNSYAIERVSGLADRVTLRDYRILLGARRKLTGGAGFRLEVGYVLGRVIEYGSNTPDIQSDDAVLLRGGVVF